MWSVRKKSKYVIDMIFCGLPSWLTFAHWLGYEPPEMPYHAQLALLSGYMAIDMLYQLRIATAMGREVFVHHVAALIFIAVGFPSKHHVCNVLALEITTALLMLNRLYRCRLFTTVFTVAWVAIRCFFYPYILSTIIVDEALSQPRRITAAAMGSIISALNIIWTMQTLRPRAQPSSGGGGGTTPLAPAALHVVASSVGAIVVSSCPYWASLLACWCSCILTT